MKHREQDVRYSGQELHRLRQVGDSRIDNSSMADGGMYFERGRDGLMRNDDEFIHRINRTAAETDPLEKDTANMIANRVQWFVKQMQRDLTAAGLVGNSVSMGALAGGVQYRHLQNGGVDLPSYLPSRNAPIMAPFSPKEISIGRVLGTGGFSIVFEVRCFRPNPQLLADFHTCETNARCFLALHAQREVTVDLYGEDDEAYVTLGDESLHGASAYSEGLQQQQQQQLVQQQQEQACQHMYPYGNYRTVARYALKHLRPDVARDKETFLKATSDLATEAQMLLVLDHPNIVRIRGWSRYGTDAIRSGRHSDFFLILERLPETMEDRLLQWRQRLGKYRLSRILPWCRAKYPDKIDQIFLERIRAASDVAAAVEYLHDRRIIHRDIKTSNIGFDIHNDLKLFDFGLARLLPPQQERLHDGYEMSRGVGTKYYVAPEIRNKEPYDLSADVYSFGIVLWEILSLCTPTEEYLNTNNKTMNTTKNTKSRMTKKFQSTRSAKPVASGDALESDVDDCRLPIRSCWPDAIQNITRCCLAEDPLKRPAMSEVRLILHQQIEDLGMHIDPRKRTKWRRSTFRLDLTKPDLRSIHLVSSTSQPSSIGMESSSGLHNEGFTGRSSEMDCTRVLS